MKQSGEMRRKNLIPKNTVRHNLLASKLEKQGLEFEMLDNAFVQIEDWEGAQKLSDDWKVSDLHNALDWFVEQFCPVTKELETNYPWSIMQVEYATDVVFKRQEDLRDIYDTLTRTGNPHGKARPSGHVSRSEAQRKLSRRDGQ
jgi:hypothetical protein